MNYIQVENLVTDRRFQELELRQEKANVFSVVGQTHTESWHSSFIKWLLEPNSTLGLGHFPLERMLNLYLINSTNCEFTLEDVYKWDLDKVKFETEKSVGISGRIDVYGESEDLIIVIENKVKANEHSNQTKKYCDYIKSYKTDKQKALFFFLTADSNKRPCDDSFLRVSYQDMFDSIISKAISHPKVSEDGKYLLEQYSANLKEKIGDKETPMALVNIDLCQSIYADFTEELDEIFEIVDSSNDNSLVHTVYNRYQGVFDEIFMSLDEKDGKYGRTPKSTQQRRRITFDDLYRNKLVTDGMPFTMRYNGHDYYAKASYFKIRKKCYFQLLDEEKQPYTVGEKVYGVYETASRAGVAAINFYNRKHGLNEISSLRGTTYWVNENGETVGQLIAKM